MTMVLDDGAEEDVAMHFAHTRIRPMKATTPSSELHTLLQALSDRADRLALRHAELKRINALLDERVRQLEAERDALRSRLGEARARVDHLLTRLEPPPASRDTDGPT